MKFAFPSAEALGARFRPAGEDDLSFLATLYAATRAEELAQTGWPAEAQARFLVDQFALQRRHWDQVMPDAERLVIERGESPIGRLYIDERPDDLQVLDIALMPESRGGGIGSAIFADLMDVATASGRMISIYVEKNNPALSLYRRMGFAPVRDEGVYDYMEWRPQTT